MLQFMGPQRVRNTLATEQQQCEYKLKMRDRVVIQSLSHVKIRRFFFNVHLHSMSVKCEPKGKLWILSGNDLSM